MDIQAILKKLENCPCGVRHTAALERVEIGHGLRYRAGEILADFGFPKNVLLVADVNTLRASAGVLDSLRAAGFHLKKLIYENFLYARAEQVEEVAALAADVDGIISVGSGSLNDICRVPAARMGKKLCLFATAPSMDGFASDTSPILRNNYKETWRAEQPAIIIADTEILAAAPQELKAAGLGDMIAKFVAITDWKISNILTGEYFCDAIAEMTLDAVRRCMALADRIPERDEEAAAAVMEALILSGLAMKLEGCSRPASGAEHMTSHFLEDYKCLRGIFPEFHGRKVGVATLLIAHAYRRIAGEVRSVEAGADPLDLDALLARFDPEFRADIAAMNRGTITDVVRPEAVQEKWQEIRAAILRYIPSDETLLDAMTAAGAATTIEDIHVPAPLMREALVCHSYMRHRIYLTRILPMAGVDLLDYVDLGR